jgi:D-alanyl-lipoteichoic acid acyltransferase DltB (MBOAT superfamily)
LLLAGINGGLVFWLLQPVFAIWLFLLLFLLKIYLHEIEQRLRGEKTVREFVVYGGCGILFAGSAGFYGLQHLHIGELGAFLVLGLNYVNLRMIYLVRTVVEGRARAPRFSELVSYLFPFHMIQAGPIQTYTDFLECHEDAPGRDRFLQGMERISQGLFKKFFLAEILRLTFLTNFAHPEPLYFLLEVQLNFLTLYLDFSGYTDMAVGVGLIIGWKTPENFRAPLRARNLIEFWERWHITLSNFIKTEIFMPLQFSLQRGAFRKRPLTAASISFCVAFVLCGLWHQVYFSFFFWGLLHGVGLSICKIYQVYLKRYLGSQAVKRLRKSLVLKMVSIFITQEFVAISWYLVSVPPGSVWYPW